MFDYGFYPSSLFYIVNKDAAPSPSNTDLFNPTSPTLGSSLLTMNGSVCNKDQKLDKLIDWNAKENPNEDLRMRYV